MENLKVSVIVPVYNRLEHLRALFICLLNQSVAPYELIITDDGSSQKVIDYIGDLLDKAKFKVKHIYQEDKGFRKTRALNNGVRESEGDYLIFCDQDLIFPEDYVEKMIKNSRKGEYLMGRAHNTTEEEKEKIIDELNLELNYKVIEKIVSREYFIIMDNQYKFDKRRRILQRLYLNKRGIRLAGMSYGVFKNDYLKVNGYDERYKGWGYEDDDFGNRLCIAGIKSREMKTDLIQLHLYHPFDISKNKSLNEDYYYKQKNNIFKNKKYIAEFGIKKSIDSDKIFKNIIK
ncbi:MAG: glycosyltransferase [Fusobacteriaceae bacterium]